MLDSRNHSGFTLIELSIVIVIIGLIVTGITQGQNLLYHAKIRSLVRDIESYSAAYNSFVSQYQAIPGDMRDAYDYWGSALGCSDNDISTTAGGCNGDGDGGVNTYITATGKREDYKAWQFMAYEKIIPGSYNGDRDDTYVVGGNVPKSSYREDVAVDISFLDTYFRFNGVAPFQPSTNKHVNTNVLTFGRVVPSTNIVPFGGFLTVEEAYSLEKKIDDGNPSAGMLYVTTGQPQSGSVSNHCVDNSNWAFVYGHDTEACSLIYKLVQ